MTTERRIFSCACWLGVGLGGLFLVLVPSGGLGSLVRKYIVERSPGGGPGGPGDLAWLGLASAWLGLA